MPRVLPPRLARVLALIGLLLGPTLGAAQPSFDCSRAGIPTEHAICASERLSALDRDLAAAYAETRRGASAAQADAIRTDQGLWLALRNGCGAQADCLENMMASRLAELRRIDGRAAMRADLTGAYCPDEASNLTVVQNGESLSFAFGLFNEVGHSCGSGRMAARRSGSVWIAREFGCEMMLRQVGADLILTAITPSACKDAYCGARAGIYEMRVPLSSRSARITNLDAYNWHEQGC